MTPAPDGTSRRELLDRVRRSLPADNVREVPMFGAIAVMVDGAMTVAAHHDGSLLVRVDPADDAALLDDPHASRAQMGRGRSMSEGWIRVDAEGLRNDAALRAWLQAATRYLERRKTPLV